MSIPQSKQDLFAVQPTSDVGCLSSTSEVQELEMLLAEHGVQRQQSLTGHEVLNCIVCNKRIPKARRGAVLGVQTCTKDQERVDNYEINLADYL
jgi:RNA polymerase-binding transcription factor DksA